MIDPNRATQPKVVIPGLDQEILPKFPARLLKCGKKKALELVNPLHLACLKPDVNLYELKLCILGGSNVTAWTGYVEGFKYTALQLLVLNGGISAEQFAQCAQYLIGANPKVLLQYCGGPIGLTAFQMACCLEGQFVLGRVPAFVAGGQREVKLWTDYREYHEKIPNDTIVTLCLKNESLNPGQFGEVIEALAGTCPNILNECTGTVDGSEGVPPLVLAVCLNKPEVVKALVRSGANLNNYYDGQMIREVIACQESWTPEQKMQIFAELDAKKVTFVEGDRGSGFGVWGLASEFPGLTVDTSRDVSEASECKGGAAGGAKGGGRNPQTPQTPHPQTPSPVGLGGVDGSGDDGWLEVGRLGELKLGELKLGDEGSN